MAAILNRRPPKVGSTSLQRKFVELASLYTKRRRHFLHYKTFFSPFRQLLVELKLYERLNLPSTTSPRASLNGRHFTCENKIFYANF